MKMLPANEILFLIGIALVFFVLNRLLLNTSLRKGSRNDGEQPPPPSYMNESLKDIQSPERSAKLGNIFHDD